MRTTAIISTLALSTALSVAAFAGSSDTGGYPAAMPTHAAPVIVPVMIKSQPLPPSNFNVSLNKTEIVRLPQTAAAIVVGNPDIADVSVHSSDTIFIVGRGYGDTNVIVLNAAGETVMNANVHVSSPTSHKNVRVFGGNSQMRATYNCSPYCQPAPILGDAAEFIEANSPKGTQITNTFAGGTALSNPATLGNVTDGNFGEGLELATENVNEDPNSVP